MAEFDKLVEWIIFNCEGGDKLHNVSGDTGGLTKFGISHSAHPSVDIEHLTLQEAKRIYKDHYWNPIRGDEIIHNPVAFVILDAAINSGVSIAVKTAQKVCGATVDGILGPVTLSYLNVLAWKSFVHRYVIERTIFYNKLVERQPSKSKFLLGWLNRINKVSKHALLIG